MVTLKKDLTAGRRGRSWREDEKCSVRPITCETVQDGFMGLGPCRHRRVILSHTIRLTLEAWSVTCCLPPSSPSLIRFLHIETFRWSSATTTGSSHHASLDGSAGRHLVVGCPHPRSRLEGDGAEYRDCVLPQRLRRSRHAEQRGEGDHHGHPGPGELHHRGSFIEGSPFPRGAR